MSATESLISAVKSYDVDTVEKLLKNDLQIEYQKRDHRSVLHIAVALIDSGIMKCAILKKGSNAHLNSLFNHEALRRVVEVLLESGRFNVNALAKSCQTVLHVAIDHCRCKYISSKDYKDLVNAVIELLLNNNADINVKNKDGQTPLMMASQNGCSHIVKLLLNWRDELGAGADLNARDIYGQTALIKAAKWVHVDVIELLLQHGCFDEFQDHRGFYALHSVIGGCSNIVTNASNDFLSLIGVLGSEETPVVLNRCASLSERGNRIFRDWPGNDSIQETVRLLVTRGRADINSLDFGGNTVLDVALESKLRINQKTIEFLKEYGATSSALLNKYPDYPNITLQYTDKLGKTPLHCLFAVLPELTLREKVEIFDFKHLLSNSPRKEALKEMTVAKDHIGRTALHYAVMPNWASIPSDGIILLINVLKLERTINETDNYGRTPLHYCEDERVYKSLVEKGANEHIQDIDGKTPQELTQLRIEEHNRHNLLGNVQDYIYQGKFNPWKIWKVSEYAYRDQFSKQLCNKVQHFMNKLSAEIIKKDPRLECRPVLVGSAEEGTKTGLPDEFDFNFILTKLSELCEVAPSPEAPNGFVHLKRKHYNAEYQPKSQDFQSKKDFDSFFNSGGFLLTAEIACRFRILYLQVMSEPEFWEGEDFFEWGPHNEVGRIYAKQLRQSLENEMLDDLLPSVHPCSTIDLKLNRPIEGRYMVTKLSLDIVPCIQLNGWWPEETLSGVNDAIKLVGCHLVFDQPQRKYPWVPFSDPYARISFAPAESRIIKDSSAVARAAYMVGKQLIRDNPKLTYVLKTCLLYCMEALKDCTNNSLLYEDINPAELRFFFEKLILCFHEFHLQDFLPCYMMPSFHLPIDNYFKSNHDMILNDSCFEYPLFSYDLYSKVCTTDSLLDISASTPQPLNETFNKEELMRKLSMGSSSTGHRRVQSESLAAGQMVRSDSQSGSQVGLSTERKENYG